MSQPPLTEQESSDRLDDAVAALNDALHILEMDHLKVELRQDGNYAFEDFMIAIARSIKELAN